MDKIAMIGLFTALQHMTEQGDLNGVNKVVNTVLHNLHNLPNVQAMQNVQTAQIQPSAENAAFAAQPLQPAAALGATASNASGVKSPMVGVFYASSSPDAAPFVRIGDNVQKGDVLCILEAMKLMNEIHAEKDGKIVDICVKNGDLVEYGQIMFKMEIT
ncbi:MAG: acetyl-CoA carboxylase biotin carboxyl carrier protein [Firmicutes bacterium]|nr:acetyl-CoA carboxylase biotin carboxyl carrier protein [Bacillota bacterium]